MSKQYSETDFQYIVNKLIDYLRECEDGTDITTWQLLRAADYDTEDFDTYDLMDIHDTLFKAAKDNHIILDMSAHENMVEGLPFNLDYIVHNKKAQIKSNSANERTW